MYQRAQAVQYANHYWNSYNPAYPYFQEDDCTNFASQVLHAGGIPMDIHNSRNQGWWCQSNQWSYSWSVAHSFYHYLNGKRTKGLQAQRVDRPEQLKWGDVICYDWDGDGKWNHNTVVTLIDGDGVLFVNAHSINSFQRYWTYTDS